MTRYYFDIYDGKDASRDNEGIEFPNFEAAMAEARRAAADIARELMLDNSPGPIEVTIRDQTEGPALFSVAWTTALQLDEARRQVSRPS